MAWCLSFNGIRGTRKEGDSGQCVTVILAAITLQSNTGIWVDWRLPPCVDSHPDSILWLYHFHVLKIICLQLANRRRQCGEDSPYSLITCSTHFTSAHIVLLRPCQSCSHPRCKVGFETYSCADQLLSNHYCENRTLDFGSPRFDHLLSVVTRSITSREAAGRGCRISFHQTH